MQVFRSILVPLDGSAFAEQALPVALDLARRAGAILQFATVHLPLPLWALSPEAPQYDPALEEEWRRQEQAYLDQTVQRIKRESNVAVSATLLTGPVGSALAAQVESTSVDLVVITTHGRGPVSRFWLGSVADKLMRTLTVPVLMVRPEEGKRPVAPAIRRILVPLDRSPFAEQILEPALALGRLTQAEFTLLYVFEPVMPLADMATGLAGSIGTELNEEMRQLAETYLEGMAARLRREGVKVECRVIATVGAAAGILDQLAGGTFDLVALATHGAGGLQRALVGSVADKVVRGAATPVLVLRPRKEETEGRSA